MKKSIHVKPKRGRPATGRDPFVGVRLPASLINEIQAWSGKNDAASRSEAIRRLVELGLTVKKSVGPTGPRRVGRARDMAAEVLNNLTVGAADTDEQAERRRHLLKGPPEFRDVRVDFQNKKAKGK